MEGEREIVGEVGDVDKYQHKTKAGEFRARKIARAST
jgi:hypothetical protein